ncbi:MAG TPA: hypothetical protein VK593_09325 [Edaphobacter sp.]|nr:hypothetical protein [Edaphobacter sp.]
MYRPLFGLAVLASILTLPLAAHADTIDDFLLTGGGHTISYSHPATTTFPKLEFLYTSTFATIDGVPGYSLGAGYNSNPGPFITLQLYVPEAIFGYPMLQFQGPQLVNTVLIPADPFDPFNPFDLETTFIPGTYPLLGVEVFPGQPEGPSAPYTLTITPQTATAVTPEPPSLALLATGVFGLLGFAAIRHGRIKLTH